MCVILLCKQTKKPTLEMLEKCHEANPDGGSIMWAEAGKAHWLKNIGPKDIYVLAHEVPGPIAIHFRWASVGKAVPELCHPFPVEKEPRMDLQGSAREVLCHNGHLFMWESIAKLYDIDLDGHVSDTRLIASVIAKKGPGILNKLSGYWVRLNKKRLTYYGKGWEKEDGILCSNTHWKYPRYVQYAGRGGWRQGDDG